MTKLVMTELNAGASALPNCQILNSNKSAVWAETRRRTQLEERRDAGARKFETLVPHWSEVSTRTSLWADGNNGNPTRSRVTDGVSRRSKACWAPQSSAPSEKFIKLTNSEPRRWGVGGVVGGEKHKKEAFFLFTPSYALPVPPAASVD